MPAALAGEVTHGVIGGEAAAGEGHVDALAGERVDNAGRISDERDGPLAIGEPLERSGK